MSVKGQYIAFLTIMRKEIKRIMRVWSQALLPSIVTSALYFTVFGNILGGRIGSIEGLAYIQFILPGLVLMNVISNSYSNTSFTVFAETFHRSMEEIVKSPSKDYVIIAGYVSGSVFRGIFSGLAIIIVASFFTDIRIENYFMLSLILLTTAILFAVLGFINGIFAKSWDDVSWISTFVLTPLSYLGGIFYSVQNLPEAWQTASLLNPIYYFIDAFRYAMTGVSSISPWNSALVGLIFTIVACAAAIMLFKRLMKS